MQLYSKFWCDSGDSCAPIPRQHPLPPDCCLAFGPSWTVYGLQALKNITHHNVFKSIFLAQYKTLQNNALLDALHSLLILRYTPTTGTFPREGAWLAGPACAVLKEREQLRCTVWCRLGSRLSRVWAFMRKSEPTSPATLFLENYKYDYKI